MSDFTLTAATPLDGYSRRFEGLAVSEASGLALVSVATPHGGEENLADVVRSAYGIQPPEVGVSAVSKDGKTRLLGMQRDQMFVLMNYRGDRAVTAVTDLLGDVGYMTDQSDSWAMLRLSGPKATSALERICMLDLHPNQFAVGAVARTVMEHLAVIILSEDAGSYLLMSPRSSAGSFVHAVETSVANIA